MVGDGRRVKNQTEKTISRPLDVTVCVWGELFLPIRQRMG